MRVAELFRTSLRFTKPKRTALDKLKRRGKLEQSDEVFIAFVASNLNPSEYLEENRDVAAAKVDPIWHWLEHGIHEGRRLSSRLAVRRGKDAERVAQGKWQRFSWRGEAIAVRALPSIPDAVIAQILEQGRHDPAILAPGALTIPSLRKFDATDLLERDGVDVHGIFEAIPTRPYVVLVVPHLVVGGADKYAADTANALITSDRRSVLMLVTDQTREAAEEWESLAILAPPQKALVVFWRDVCCIGQVKRLNSNGVRFSVTGANSRADHEKHAEEALRGRRNRLILFNRAIARRKRCNCLPGNLPRLQFHELKRWYYRGWRRANP